MTTPEMIAVSFSKHTLIKLFVSAGIINDQKKLYRHVCYYEQF